MKKINVLVLALAVFIFGFINLPSVEAANIKLTMKQTKYSVYEGYSQQIKVTVSGTDAKNVKWKTSNSKLATVSNKGLVKAIKTGKVNITAYVANTNAKAVATVTISKKVLNSQEVFKKVNPAVVHIQLYNKYNQKVSTGSGFIVNANGTIVTNHHVVIDYSEAKYAKIKLSDGRVYETDQVLDYNANRDLAVLKIAGAKNLPTVVLSDSDKVETGEKVFALGSPLGINNSITEGIVSNQEIILEDKQRYIQSSAPISGGNSGGTLVNRFGEVIGVNVATFTEGQNMNLAIPINDFKKMTLKKYNTMLKVNREAIPPLFGEGDVKEQEDNNLFVYADNIRFKKAWIKSKASSNEDIDLYYFDLTDNATINVTSFTDNPELSDSFGFGLFDENGEVIQWAWQDFDSEYQTYYTQLTKKLTPGRYYLLFSPYEDSQKYFSNEDYMAMVEFE